MKILVFLKQVPQLDEVRFDRANRVVREGVATMCNPLDELALGTALELRGPEDEVVVVTMGPPAAREVLDSAVAAGADRAILVTDRRFKGADTLATARALAQIVRPEQPDLALFGRATLDGATAQLGQQIAELVGLPHLSEVVAVSGESGGLTVERETEETRETWSASTPVVLTIRRGPAPPETQTDRTADITELSAEDLGGTPTEYGTRGSPTFVKEVRVRPVPDGSAIEDAAAGAARLREAAAAVTDETQTWTPESGPERDIWVLAHRHEDGTVEPAALEGLACARAVAADLQAQVTAVVLGADADDTADELAARGADRILLLRHPDLDTFTTVAYAEALAQALAHDQPYVLVAPWSAEGRDYVPRVAARLGLGLTGDATGIEVEPGETPRVLWVKPAWAGTVDALVVCRTTPSLGTLRPGSYRPLEPRAGATATVDVIEVDVPVAEPAGPTLERREVVAPDSRLDHAQVVLCLGADLPPDVVEQATSLAERWGAGVGGTTSAVRSGLVPEHAELDVLRRSISPALCVALGVRERAELAAVRGAERLATVHASPDASAHSIAALRVVADPEAVLAALGDVKP